MSELKTLSDLYPDSRPTPRHHLADAEFQRLERLLAAGEPVSGMEAGELFALQSRGRLNRAEAELVDRTLELRRGLTSHDARLAGLQKRITTARQQVEMRDADRAANPGWQEAEAQALSDAVHREANRLREENRAAIGRARFSPLGAPPPPHEPLVALLRKHVADGLDPAAVADRLNADLVRTPGGESSWTDAVVSDVLGRALPEELTYDAAVAQAQKELERRRPPDPAETLRTLEAEFAEVSKAGPGGSGDE